MSRDPLDDLLDNWRVEPPSPGLAERIVARSRAVEQIDVRAGWYRRLAALFGGGWSVGPQVAGIAVALLIGFWYGAGGVASSTAQEIDAGQLMLGPNLESEWLG